MYTELLAQCPVHRGSVSEMLGAVSVSDLMAGERDIVNVLSYDGVEAVLRDGATFSSAGYAESMGLVMGHTILEMDEPEHGRYRKLIQQAFTPPGDGAVGARDRESGAGPLHRRFCRAGPGRSGT